MEKCQHISTRRLKKVSSLQYHFLIAKTRLHLGVLRVIQKSIAKIHTSPASKPENLPLEDTILFLEQKTPHPGENMW